MPVTPVVETVFAKMRENKDGNYQEKIKDNVATRAWRRSVIAYCKRAANLENEEKNLIMR